MILREKSIKISHVAKKNDQQQKELPEIMNQNSVNTQTCESNAD